MPIRAAAALVAAATLAAPALAEFREVEAEGTVPQVADRLAAAVEEAGATLFARVDHAAGAEAAGLELEPATLLVFGNPELGTPVLQADLKAGLYLPLRVLVMDRDGQTFIVYEDVRAMLDELDVPPAAPYLEPISDALEALTTGVAEAPEGEMPPETSDEDDPAEGPAPQ
ncbi:protein of unknown function DUF302 [Wenxinia saemankumensis]|uniref:DUF302 domain-containing protein n=2 Tax=Wenxinia saemankumensis TaxID=1447782 RepID=A0A1M6GRN0_9RHOB|nr:protein of unknown function DUF302 [Wenxinia saemankumensis]